MASAAGRPSPPSRVPTSGPKLALLADARRSWHLDLAGVGLAIGLLVAAAGRHPRLRGPSLVGAPVALAGVLAARGVGAGTAVGGVGGTAVVGVAVAAGLACGFLVERALGRRVDQLGSEPGPGRVGTALDPLVVGLALADVVVWLGVPDTEGAVLVGAALAPLAVDAVTGRLGWRPSGLGAPVPVGLAVRTAATLGWSALVGVALVGGVAALPPGGSVGRAVVAPALAWAAALVVAVGALVTSERARPRR